MTALLIAATNMPGQIVAAIWRRFDIQIDIGLPDEAALVRILRLYLDPFTLSDAAAIGLAREMRQASPALIRQVCECLKRTLVLGDKLGWDMAREAVFGRVLESVRPPESQDLPPLWRTFRNSKAVAALPWPLERGS